MAPLPVPLGQGTTGAANGKIYVAGGFVGGTSVTNALRIYDIATNTWTSGANMPTSPGVEAAAGAVVNGKFYVMGGDDFNNGLNTTFIYDIATNTWTTGATLPDMRTNTYGTASNGLIYVYGGVILPAFTTTDTLLRYDPVANSWTNLGSAGTAGARGNYGGISPLGTGQLLITDGADASGASTTATHIFTISGGTFSAGPAMIGNRAGQAQGTLPDGRVLVADGFNTASTTMSTVELLTTPCPSPTPTATPTATSSPTATPTATFTPSPTFTPTPTATATFTPTPTATGYSYGYSYGYRQLRLYRRGLHRRHGLGRHRRLALSVVAELRELARKNSRVPSLRWIGPPAAGRCQPNFRKRKYIRRQSRFCLRDALRSRRGDHSSLVYLGVKAVVCALLNAIRVASTSRCHGR